MKRTYFTVTGMSCAACSSSVERAVNALDGVIEASVNLTTGKLSVNYDENVINPKNIESAVIKIGFGINHDNFEDNLDKKIIEIKKNAK